MTMEIAPSLGMTVRELHEALTDLMHMGLAAEPVHAMTGQGHPRPVQNVLVLGGGGTVRPVLTLG
jgi:hypothetical protein